MIRSFELLIPYIFPAYIWSVDEVYTFITRHITPHISGVSVVCISSKIISLIEGRYLQGDDPGVKERLARELSSACWRHQEIHPLICVTSGGVFAYTEIDESNLPPGSSSSHSSILLTLQDDDEHSYERVAPFKISLGSSQIALLSHSGSGQGVVAVGWSGIRPLQDYRGVIDLCHQPMQHTRLNRVDALAGMAGFLMGEGDEGRPIVIIEGVDQEVFFVMSKLTGAMI